MPKLKKPASIDLSAIEELRGDAAPLYKKYSDYLPEQDAYVEMDEYGFISASYNPEVGNAVRMDVYQRRTLRFGITPYLSGDELADILSQEKVKNLFATIYAGHDVQWDGRNNVWYLDGEAESAIDELADYLDRVEPSEETAQAIIDEENEEASC